MGIAESLRQTMRQWASGITVVTTANQETRTAITVSAFTSVSLHPALILVCVRKDTETAQQIQQNGYFAVSILGAGQEHISAQAAGYTDLPDGADRLHNLDTHIEETGAPVLSEAIGWMDCRLHEKHDGGSHWIIVGEVVATSEAPTLTPPLLYFNRGYHTPAPQHPS